MMYKKNKKMITIVVIPSYKAGLTIKKTVKAILKEKKGKFIERGFILSGIGESQMAPYVSKLEEQYKQQLWIKSHPRIGLSVEVEISITAFNVENGEELVESALKELKEIVLKLNGKILEER